MSTSSPHIVTTPVEALRDIFEKMCGDNSKCLQISRFQNIPSEVIELIEKLDPAAFKYFMDEVDETISISVDTYWTFEMLLERYKAACKRFLYQWAASIEYD